MFSFKRINRNTICKKKKNKVFFYLYDYLYDNIHRKFCSIMISYIKLLTHIL